MFVGLFLWRAGVILFQLRLENPATPSGFRLHAVPASIPHATRLQINCVAAIVQHSGFQFSIPFSPVKHLA
jgi:hypothetical protein